MIPQATHFPHVKRSRRVVHRTRAKEQQPEAARVLLTGHADKQSAIQAINDVGLYQYLEKPWDNQQLLLVIQSASGARRGWSYTVT